MECAAQMAGQENITMFLACAYFPDVASQYFRELGRPERKQHLPGIDPDKSVLLWAYLLLSMADFRHVISLLPPRAFEPPTSSYSGAILPLLPPLGDNESMGWAEVDRRLIGWVSVCGKTSYNGTGAICLAAAQGNIDALRVLLKHWQWTVKCAAAPLRWACLYGQERTVRLLLSDMAKHLETEQLTQMLLDKCENDNESAFTPVQCLVYLMHEPAFTATGARILTRIWGKVRKFSYPMEEIEQAKKGAIVALCYIAATPSNWNGTGLKEVDAICYTLQPLPRDPHFFQLKMLETLARSRGKQRIRLMRIARTWLSVNRASKEALDMARRFGQQEVVALVQEFQREPVEE